MRRLLLLLMLPLTLIACSRSSAPETIEQQLYVFGTIVTLTFHGLDEEQATRAGAEVNRMFQEMHRNWHAWEQGELTALNQAIAEGRSAPVPPDLLPLIEKSQEACRLSDCLFNPAIGQLIGLWGFHSSERPSGPPPPREEIAKLVALHPSMLDITLDHGQLSSSNPAVQFDVGGIAKGYAVELALATLRKEGVKDAIVNAGGGLGVIGSKGAQPWRVGIRHPQGAGILGSLAVHDGEQVHTSGNYERFREDQGVHYAHILDPRTGWPVEGVTSATVIGRDGAMTDAAATALVVAGPKEWYRIARQMGVEAAMLVDDSGTVYMDPGMAERVEFEGERPHIVLSDPL